MEVVIKGSPTIEVGFEAKVIDSYKAVDSELSTTSKNPVQNKVIATELEMMQTELDSNAELIEDLQNTKIDKEADDYYPQLSVGMADNLAGQEDATPSEFNYRQSGGGAILDGTARIEAVKGNSMVWNQCYNKTISQFNNIGIQGNYNNGRWVYSGIATTSNTISILPSLARANGRKGHKMIVVLEGTHNFDALRCAAYYSAGTQIIAFNEVFVCQDNTSVEPVATIVLDKEYSANLSFRLVDLTLMFGAGNEPTTIEEFYARIPQNIDLYAYNEGEVIHSNVDAIKSVGLNLWDEKWELGMYNTSTGKKEASSAAQIRSVNLIDVFPNKTYFFAVADSQWGWLIYFDKDKNFISSASITNRLFTTPNNAAYLGFHMNGSYGGTYKGDICINLSNSAKNGTYEPYISREQRLDIIKKYFPNGMRSAGTAHDEIRWNKQTQKWEKVERVAEMDLGSLNWSYYASDTPFFYATDNRIFSGQKLLCSKYTDNEIKAYTNLRVYDSSYTDAASFKAAIQGVVLYYELAEPIVTEIDEDINLDYEVWDGGTEKAIATEPTTPIKADIVYGFNAYGVIKDLRTQIATLQTMLSQMQLAMASMVNEM